MAQRPTFRIWEIFAVVAAGALAAGGALVTIEAITGGGESTAEVSGPTEDKSYQVAGFDELSTVGPQDVVVSVGGDFAVHASGSAEALARLEAVVEDGQLKIRPKGDFRNGFDWSSVESATFFVTMPKLETVQLAGSGDVSIDRVEGPKFAGTVAGPGELSVGTLEVDEADLSIAGSGNLVVSGRAKETRASIGGSGEIQAIGLASETATVNIGGSGDAALAVSQEAHVSVMGSGDVDIEGSARCSVSRMGSGEVTCNGVSQ